MHWSWKVTSAPATEPLSLADAKEQLRVDHSDEDDLITSLITVAREWVENYCDRSLVTQTLVCKLDRFPYDHQSIMVPRGPVASITSIEYVDGDGVTQTWDSSNYTLDNFIEPARLEPAYNESYPSVRHQNNAVTITYQAGVADDAVESNIIHAIKLILTSLYEMRGADVCQQVYQPSMNVDALLSPYRLRYRGPWI